MHRAVQSWFVPARATGSVQHTFANRSDAVARMLNIHGPAGFDLRLESD